MDSYRRWWQSVFAALLFVLVVTLWIVFAPVQLGGQTGFVIITGNSMEPGFHFGDFVIVRQATDYQIGDVVAYRSQDLGTYVFHRIIGQNLDRFILKGDHNDWVDEYQPVRSELLGKSWLRLAGLGKFIRWLRTPSIMAILTGGMGVLLMTSIVNGSSPNRKPRNKKPIKDWLNLIKDRVFRHVTPKPGQDTAAMTPKTKAAHADRTGKTIPAGDSVRHLGLTARKRGEAIAILFFVLGFLALASLVLGILAFTRPVLQEVTSDSEYEQKGSFSYSETSPAGIYDADTLTTGQPIFTRLNCLVNLNFDYFLNGDQVEGLIGTHQLTATIREDTSSWSRTLPLEPETSFRGKSFSKVVILNLCKLEAQASFMEEKTDLRSTSYSVVINPRVKITGTVGGRVVQETFLPELIFQFDKIQAHVIRADPDVDPLNPIKKGVVKNLHTEENHLTIFSLKPEVSTARTTALIGLGLSLGGLVAIWLYLSASARRSPWAYVQIRYGSMLVEVREGIYETASPVVDVLTLEELVRLAERHDALILHETSGPTDRYCLKIDGMTYRYAHNPAGSDTPPKAPSRRRASKEKSQ